MKKICCMVFANGKLYCTFPFPTSPSLSLLDTMVHWSFLFFGGGAYWDIDPRHRLLWGYALSSDILEAYLPCDTGQNVQANPIPWVRNRQMKCISYNFEIILKEKQKTKTTMLKYTGVYFWLKTAWALAMQGHHTLNTPLRAPANAASLLIQAIEWRLSFDWHPPRGLDRCSYAASVPLRCHFPLASPRCDGFALPNCLLASWRWRSYLKVFARYNTLLYMGLVQNKCWFFFLQKNSHI